MGNESAAGNGLAQPAGSSSAAQQKFPADVAGALMSREHVLHKVRTALARSTGQPIEEPPPVRLRVPVVDLEDRIESFCERVEALAGKAHRATSVSDARAYVAGALAARSAVASNAPILRECGVTAL